MAHRISDSDTAPEASPPQALPADQLQDEHDQFQTLCHRLETAATVLIRLRNRLLAHASECQGCNQDREFNRAEVGSPDPDGVRR